MQSNFRKLMAICLATALFVTSLAAGLSAFALGTTNLLANLTLSDTTGITMDAANNGFTAVGDANSHATAYFNNLTLEKNSSYEYSFDITFHSDPAGQIPRFALRDGGQWFNFIGAWGQQGRFNNTNDINPFIGLLSLSLTADTTYNFTFELEPTRARLLIDDEPQVNTAGNTDAEGWVTLPAVKDGKIGIDTAQGVNFTMENVSLVKTVQGAAIGPSDAIAAIEAIGTVDAYSREAIDAARAVYEELSDADKAEVTNYAALTGAEEAFAAINLLNGVADQTITAPAASYFDVTLDKDSTYVYEFDITYDGAYNATFPWFVLRENSESAKGQYINAGAYGCIRVCDNLNFDEFEGNATMSATAGTPVSFKIILEPERIKVYMNGTEVAFGANVGATIEDGWVSLPTVENGKVGFTGGNAGFSYTISDVSLTKVADNLAADIGDLNVTCGTPVYLEGITLDKTASYEYSFDITYDGAYNATFPWFVLRENSESAKGQYINAGAYGCIRVCDNLNFDEFEGNATMSATPGTPVSFRILMEPERIKVYINNQVVSFGANVGATIEDGWVSLPAVENGKMGFTGGNTGFTYTISNISLIKTGDVVADPAVGAVVDAINAIGSVNAYSRVTIEAARELFDALTAEQQTKVTNAAALTAAESAFAAMNLLANLSVSNSDAAVVDTATNSVKITAGSTVYFNNLTMKKNSTYVYEFDITYDSEYNATFPWLVLREGGQYISMGAYSQMRVCDNANFDIFEAWASMAATAGTPLSMKIIMEPERIKVYMDGQLVSFTPNVNVTVTDGWVSLPAVKDGKFGVAGGNAGYTYTLSDISLTEIPGDLDPEEEAAIAVQETIAAIDAIGTVDATSGAQIQAARKLYDALTAEQQAQVTNAAALTAAESAYAALNLLADATLTANGVATLENGNLSVDGSSQEAGGTFYFDGITLKEKATYVYDFDLTLKAPLNTNLITMALRDDGEGKGQFIGFWGNTDQVRICKTSDTNTFEDIYNPFGLEENKTYSFHIVMEPERIQIWVDGVLRKPALCGNAEAWTALPAVKNGLLGIYYDVGTNITLENLWLGVVGAEDIAAAEAVDALISAIGNVTLQSGDAIEAAEAAYANLTDAQRAYVSGYATLTAARADYNLLVAQDQASAADKAAAKAVMDKIDAIGTVTTASKAVIENAEAAYAALSENQKTLVTNYDKLIAARTTYEDAVKAAEVDALIAAIGTVNADSQAAIEAARAAYDALTADQKAMVNSLSTLEKAEKAFAALNGTKDVYYYYPSINDLMGANYWPNNVMQSAVSTGGIHYKWFNAGTDWRTGLNIPLEMDGLHLTLGNVAFTSANKKFAVYLADKDAQEAYTSSGKTPLIFIFNCETGELKVTSESRLDAGETIIQTDALKAENLVGKQVELKLTANGDGYTVSLLGETGTITKAMLDAALALTDYENVYLTLCPWDWGASVQVEFDLLAVHGGEKICSDSLTAEQLAAIDSVIAKIDAIGEVTEESESAITAARAAYDALGATEQGFVGNYAALVNAEWKLQSLKAEAGIEYKDKDYYRPSRNDTMGTNYWTNNLFISDLAEGGIHFEWNMTGTDWRMGIGKELTLDGLHLVFSNLKYTSANKRFAVYISDLRDGPEDWGAGYASISNQPLMIVFDGNNGVVKACTENMVEPTGTVLIESPALLAENMEGKDFDLKITANGDGTYTLSVMGMEAILTKELLASAVGLTEYEEVYVTLCPWDWTTSTVMNLDLVAIHGGKEICADEVTEEVLAGINGTIETIKAIFNEKGQVTLASYENLIKAREMYEALDDYVKGVVENYQDLVDAEEVYEIVEAIAGIGTVTAEKADAIRMLNDMYKSLDPYKRPMVGNYLVLRDALLDVYLLQRGDKEEGTIPNDPDSNISGDNGSTSPITGEGVLGVLLAVVLAAIACGALIVCKRKSSKVL